VITIPTAVKDGTVSSAIAAWPYPNMPLAKKLWSMTEFIPVLGFHDLKH